MSQEFSFEVLSDGNPVLKVYDFCIQTTAKRAYREVAAVLLEGCDESASLGELLDMLERFLNSTNFSALRAEHPELAGGIQCLVKLYRRDDGDIGWEMVDSR